MQAHALTLKKKNLQIFEKRLIKNNQRIKILELLLAGIQLLFIVFFVCLNKTTTCRNALHAVQRLFFYLHTHEKNKKRAVCARSLAGTRNKRADESEHLNLHAAN